ncbi:MAG: signal recognition particle-docking protein FtsY, partial [Corynebacterium sp.]|nr:signal recognition particle-docking protein FtsY [Corynebacterium sp.]
MNTTYLIIVAAIVIVILVVALVVLLGLLRQKSKTVSFTKEESPKELTQQEKSGNYQATGGFNFAPATAKEPEPQLRDGQKLPDIPEVPKVAEEPAAPTSPLLKPANLDDITFPEAPGSEAADAQDATDAQEAVTVDKDEPHPKPSSVVDDHDVQKVDEPAPSETTSASFETPADDDVVIVDDYQGSGPGFRAQDVRTSDFESETPLDPAKVDEILAGTPLGKDADDSLFDQDIEEPLSFEPKISPTEPVEPQVIEAEVDEEVFEFPETPLFASVAEENPVDETAIKEAEDAAEAARAQADAAGTALDETPVPPPGSVAEPAVPSQPLEEIAPAVGRLGKLRGRLSRSQNVIGQGVLGILSAGDLDEDAWEEIEDTLLMADLGTKVTMEVVENLREKIASRGVSSEAEARAMLRETLIEACKPEFDRSIKAMPNAGKPAVVLVVGVNGTGKTTTTGKLARVLVSMGHKVLLGAADTFRAAAADQLETWGRRVGASTVRGAEGADPASVAFDAVAKGVADQVDVVLIDTAGRLHTSVGLMDQLGKVKRVVEKKAAVDEVLLVLDATVGQNGLMQARTFRDVVDITGVVLTKLDGTAKGGIVFQVQEELGVPVKL